MKKETLLKELVRLAKNNIVKDDEFTIADYMNECKKEGVEITEYAARAKLCRMVNRGQLERRKVVMNAAMTSVFKFKKGSSPPLSNPRLDE
jgi:hypothetical protein